MREPLGLVLGFFLAGGCFSPIGSVPEECADATDCPNELIASGLASTLQDDPSFIATDETSAPSPSSTSSASSASPVVIPAAFAPAPEESPWAQPTDPHSSTQLPPMLNPLGLPFFDSIDADVLVSLLLDDLILDLFAPTPAPAAAPADNDLPYLERLCREGDTPDYLCRQRYGN